MFITALRPNNNVFTAKGYPVPFHARVEVGGVLLNADSLLIVALVPLMVAGAVITYRLYDVGYALDLAHAARLLEGQATGRPRPTRR